MTVFEWRGVTAEMIEIVAPPWEAVEEAIRRLDTKRFNDVYLVPKRAEPETYLCIGGGAGRYVVTGSVRSEQFPTVIDASKEPNAVAHLVVGGQLGAYPANWILDLETTLRAARHFHTTADFSGAVTWIEG